jgi:hypothetical protein
MSMADKTVSFGMIGRKNGGMIFKETGAESGYLRRAATYQ